jgi:hypothetical protein
MECHELNLSCPAHSCFTDRTIQIVQNVYNLFSIYIKIVKLHFYIFWTLMQLSIKGKDIPVTGHGGP